MKKRSARDVEVVYTRSQTIAKMLRLVDSLAKEKPFSIQIKGERLSVPKDALVSIEHERSGGVDEIEFQVRWKQKPAIKKKRAR